MASSADTCETGARRRLMWLSGNLGEDVFEYVVLAVSSVLQDAQRRSDAVEELSECLWPYLAGVDEEDLQNVIQDLVGLRFPDAPTGSEVAVSSRNEQFGGASSSGGRGGGGLLCSVENLILMYGGSLTPLLNNATLQLYKGRRYGIVGSNGRGKTTLLSKIATGELKALSRLSCTYIHYEGILNGVDSGMSCVEYVKLMTGRADAAALLQGIGFTEQACKKAIQHLSGGWRMRLALGVAMSSCADLYLLDEPTNHLDCESRAWLENYMMGVGSSLTVLVVSHDQAFLDRVCTDIIHFTPEGKLAYYEGNAEAFRQQTGIEPGSAEAIVARADEVRGSTRPGGDGCMTLPNPGRQGLPHVVATFIGCNFRYSEDQPLALKDVTLQLTMRCRLGIMGPNGAGKSTLLNLLAGELLPISEDGEACTIWRHPDLRLAYIAQQHFFHLAYHMEKTPVQYIQARFASGWDEELERRLVLSQTAEAIEHRRVMAGKYGGRPYYWDAEAETWKGRAVASVLGRRVENGQLQYLVSWEVGEAEEGVEVEHTWEIATKLRVMGVEMLCLAHDSQRSYSHMGRRALTMHEVSSHLNSFGVTESMLHQPMRGFSAGQMSKLVLAAATWTKPHLLLLDEPTNFLDAQALAALARSIKLFQGGTLVVSHNADFLEETCHEIWQVEDGCLAVIGNDGASKDAIVRAKLRAQAEKDKEKQARELERRLGPSVAWETNPEDVGRVLKQDLVVAAFEKFVGTTLPEHAIQFGVDSFMSIAEERQPSGSVEWLAVVVAAVQMVESIGFEQLGDMDLMAPLLLAMLRNLLITNAVGSSDGGYTLQRTHLNKIRTLRWREKVAYFHECCYCGREVGREEMDVHERECTMSPMRCGKNLGGLNFEMFHGTSAKNAAAIQQEGFQPSVGGMLGRGVYCSRELRKARRYGPVVLRLEVSLGRVIKIDRKDHPLRTIWQTQVGGNFDCAWVPPNSGVVPSGLEENCVRSPAQIRVLGRVEADARALF